MKRKLGIVGDNSGNSGQNNNGHNNGQNNSQHKRTQPTSVTPEGLISTPLLPPGYFVPATRNIHPSKRMRQLLATEPYLFGPGVYDPMTAQLVMYHGFKAVY